MFAKGFILTQGLTVYRCERNWHFSLFQTAVHLRLAEQTLITLTGYLDWVKFAVLYTQDCIILQMLCLLLEEDALKIRAADCLLLIVSRKVSIAAVLKNKLHLFIL